MPARLSLRTAALLVALAFGLMFAVQALLGGGASAAKPAATTITGEVVADSPGAAPNLKLVAAGTVPALRQPRHPHKPRKPAAKPKPAVRKPVKAAPKPKPKPAAVTPPAPVQPAPTATPRYVPPAPQHVTPAPRPKPAAPKPTPAPTSTPQDSGAFDTSGGS
jgi:outer membrane biosynthesis protein TonB